MKRKMLTVTCPDCGARLSIPKFSKLEAYDILSKHHAQVHGGVFSPRVKTMGKEMKGYLGRFKMGVIGGRF